MAFPLYTKEFHTASYPAISPTRPELSTAGKVVLITGGGSGLGPHIAHAFATSGSTKITVIGRTESSLLSTKKGVEAQHPGVKVLTFVADIVDSAAVNRAFEATKEEAGPVDVLVSNAAYLPDAAPVATSNVDEWFRGMEINVKGNLVLVQALVSYGSENPTLIHLSTAGAHVPPLPAGLSAYAVSKLAAVKLMEYVAFENERLRVMVVHPGVLKTDMNAKSVEAGLTLPYDDSQYFP